MILIVLIICLIGACAAKSFSLPAEVLFDDSVGLGRKFEGIGGLSAGATTKLLVNYPTELRDQILDYLFKPNFGAALHILKVEIGGDAQSTDGTEASHMHNSWDENYERGYEWWLMKEAKTRNPDIKLYGLPWGFPGWVGQGTQSPYKNVSVVAEYIVKWINGAKVYHNLTIDYIGIWNEHAYSVSCMKTLRTLLDNQGFTNVNIIVTDGGWEIVPVIEKDPALASIIHAVGCHYPGTYSNAEAMKCGKPLWSSEDFSTFNDNIGGGCWARILNQNYVNGFMTSTISWNLIGSYYKGLPFYSDGLMTAAEPWSGFYDVKTPIWFTAHTAQFTSPGWKYLAHGSGVGKLPSGGSYVGIVNHEGDQLTIVIETMTHDHSLCIRPKLPKYTVEPQTVTVTLKGSFAKIAQMNVWYSKLGFNGTQNIMFEKKESLMFNNGQATLSLGLDEVFTLTTVETGQKGSYPDPPASKPFPLPYKDDFEGNKLYEEPYNLVPQIGSYEVLSNGSNQFIRQTVLTTPVLWCLTAYLNKTYSIIGDVLWADVFVEIDVEIPDTNGTDGVFVAARVDRGSCESYSARGIFFFVLQDRYVLANDIARTLVLVEGPLATRTGRHKLSLSVQKNTAQGAIDGKWIFLASIPATPSHGWAAIGTDSYGLADFDNLYLATKEEGLERMNMYSEHSVPQPLYFIKEHN